MRIRPNLTITCSALGLLLVSLGTTTAVIFAWQNAWQQGTRDQLSHVATTLAEAIALEWGENPSPDQLHLAQPQLETALRLTPGLLGLTLVSFTESDSHKLLELGDPPDKPTRLPSPPSISISTDSGSQRWQIGVPIGNPQNARVTYLWLLFAPNFAQPHLLAWAFAFGSLALFSVLFIVAWWWLKSLDQPLPLLVNRARTHADAALVASGLVLTSLLGALIILAQDQNIAIKSFFEIISPAERRIVQATVQVSQVGTESIASYFRASQEVTAPEFSTYIQHLLSYPGVEAWAWLTVVSPSNFRSRINHIRERDSAPNFRPWSNAYPQGIENPPPLENLLMVEFVEPQRLHQDARGFLYQSEVTRATLASRAIARAAPTATTLQHLVHLPGGPPRIALLHPVFQPDNQLLGCVGAAIRPDRILQTALGDDSRMIIDWFEIQPDGNLSWLATSAEQTSGPADTGSRLTASRPFFAFGNTYLLRTSPGRSFQPAKGAISASALVIGGFAFAAAAWWIASSEARFRRNLQLTVAQRTAELQATQARYADLARRNRTFVWETDPNGLYQFLDPVVEDVLGYRPEELVGNVYLWDLHPEEGREELRQDVFRHFREKLSVTNYENRAIAKNGRVIWLSSSGGPLLDEHGNFIGYRGWDTDITQEKERELIAARTQRLESLGILSGGIAHDLNNALGPLLISADLLRLDETDPQRRKLIQTILDSANRAANMVRQVLLFARGSQGQKVPLDPRHLMVDVASLVRDTFPKSITLDLQTPQGPFPFILGDPTQLHQVLLNLCINARDAMPGGGELRLALSLQPPPTPGQPPEIHFTVTDTGHGMNAEVQARAFDPFFTTKEVGRGTGLGLSTSHTIVLDHGGRILLESKPGAGTRFTVCLPCLSTDGLSPPESNSTHLPRGAGETILVVDDDDQLRSTTCQLLSSFGFSPLSASHGLQASELLRTPGTNVHAALIDLRMPTMDGPATIRALRQIAPQLPILATSGAGSLAEIEHSSGCALQGFLPKPYRPEELLWLLRSVLSQANSFVGQAPPDESRSNT